MKITILKKDLQNIKYSLGNIGETLSGIEEKLVKLESEFNQDLLDSICESVNILNNLPELPNLGDLFKVVVSTSSLLSLLQKGDLEISSEVVDSLLSAVDVILKVQNILNEKLQEPDIKSFSGNEIEINIPDISVEGLLYSLKNFQQQDSTSIKKEKSLKETSKIKIIEIKLNQEFLQQFITETWEYIGLIEHNLLAAESSPEKRGDAELVNIIFRALHNMKGGSSLVLSTIQETISPDYALFIFRELSHASETILQTFRDSHKPLDEETIIKLFLILDNLKILLNEITTGKSANPASIELTNSLKTSVNIDTTLNDLDVEKKQISAEEKESRLTAFLNVANQSIGTIEDCHKKIIEMDLNPDQKILEKYIRALKNLISSAAYQDYKDLSNILKQVKDILLSVKEQKSIFDDMIWEILQESISGIKKEIAAITAQKEIESQNNQKVKIEKQPLSQTKEQHSEPKESIHKRISQMTDSGDTLRVKHDKIDKLMNLIGELIVTKNIFNHISKKLFVEYGLSSIGREVKDVGSMISRIADDLQLTIMDVRMLPILNVFQKFPRMVRDICKSTGKEVNLVMEGEETHLDKAIIEKINDPLMHLIRNSIDHGIEPVEERIKNGKNQTGLVKLKASTHGNIVSIEISDDGKGLDPEAIRLKAVEKGIIDPERAAEIADKDLLDLLFYPGFSTAEKVTEFSGRGVGLDIVRTNITALNGLIEISSEKGAGTTIKLLLPLTLVISKGLMIEVADQNFVLPLESIQETVKVSSDRIHKFKNHYVTEIRGEVISLIPLSQIFGFVDSDITEYMEKLLSDEIIKIVVMNLNGQKAGLIVSNFSNEQEVVIKPLDHDLSKVKGVSGATILGDGKIVLILNPDEILQLMFNKLKSTNN